jgi:hypothetical protein
LAFGKRPGEELYDLRKDPHYLKNVASDSDYTEIRNSLSGTLLTVMEEHNDPRIAEEVCRFEMSPYIGSPAADWYEGEQNGEAWSPPTPR